MLRRSRRNAKILNPNGPIFLEIPCAAHTVRFAVLSFLPEPPETSGRQEDMRTALLASVHQARSAGGRGCEALRCTHKRDAFSLLLLCCRRRDTHKEQRCQSNVQFITRTMHGELMYVRHIGGTFTRTTAHSFTHSHAQSLAGIAALLQRRNIAVEIIFAYQALFSLFKLCSIVDLVSLFSKGECTHQE